jgi:hypothetical protein
MGGRLSIWYVVFPAVTMLLVWPHVRELPPLLITKNFNLYEVLIALPFWVGLVAAPGYLYAWSGQYVANAARRSVRLWVGASLLAALVASLGGFVSVLAVMPMPFDVGSIVCSALMVWRFVVSRSDAAQVYAIGH